MLVVPHQPHLLQQWSGFLQIPEPTKPLSQYSIAAVDVTTVEIVARAKDSFIFIVFLLCFVEFGFFDFMRFSVLSFILDFQRIQSRSCEIGRPKWTQSC